MNQVEMNQIEGNISVGIPSMAAVSVALSLISLTMLDQKVFAASIVVGFSAGFTCFALASAVKAKGVWSTAGFCVSAIAVFGSLAALGLMIVFQNDLNVATIASWLSLSASVANTAVLAKLYCEQSGECQNVEKDGEAGFALGVSESSTNRRSEMTIIEIELGDGAASPVTSPRSLMAGHQDRLSSYSSSPRRAGVGSPLNRSLNSAQTSLPGRGHGSSPSRRVRSVPLSIQRGDGFPKRQGALNASTTFYSINNAVQSSRASPVSNYRAFKGR